MSKYRKLWEYVSEHCDDKLVLSFDEIRKVIGFEIDHAFLKFKKELIPLGFKAGKISIKEKTVIFEKIKND